MRVAIGVGHSFAFPVMIMQRPLVLDVRISRNVVNITYRRMCFGEDA